MSMRLNCPVCQKRLKANADQAGKRVRCPGCQNILTLPGAMEQAVAAPAPVATRRQPAIDHFPAAERPPGQPRNSDLVGALATRKLPLWYWLAGSALAVVILCGTIVLLVPGRSPETGNGSDQEVAGLKMPPPPADVGKSGADSGKSGQSGPEAGKPGAKGSVDSGKSGGADLAGKKPAAPPPAPVTMNPAKLRDQLARGLRLTGSLVFDRRTEGFNPQTTYHQWKADVRLENTTSLALEFGSDLFFIEAVHDGADHEGVAVFNRVNPVTSASSYGLVHNYEIGGMSWFKHGGYISIRFGGNPEPDGSLAAGGSWALKRTFEQATWLREELRAQLLLVLPEMRVTTTSGVEKFRAIASFKMPVAGVKDCPLLSHKVVPLQPETLKQLLQAPENNRLTKILAANWLAEAQPKEAVRPLVELGQTLNEGQLCATCLELLAALKGDGLGDHALSLLKSKKRPNGIRQLAAIYLGAVKHEPALDLLITAAADLDDALARGAIVGLGSYGGPRAVKTLLDLLSNNKQAQRHLQIAQSLVHTKDAEAIRSLEELARGGNMQALEALAQAGLPETFAFFVDLAGTSADPKQRDVVVRGLRASGGDKALPRLLAMLEKENPPLPQNLHDTTELVRQLIQLNSPKTTPRLVELATNSNLRALQVLAGSKNESVREPLTELALKAEGAALAIALYGLGNNWAKESVAVFAKYVDHDDAAVVKNVLNGLRNSKDVKAAGLLAKLLKHKDRNIQSEAGWALGGLPLGDAAPKVAEALLATTDDGLISGLASALVNAKWKDLKFARRLGDKLAATKGFSRFDLVRLLRQLSGDAMGPRDYNEFSLNPDDWVRRWIAWAAKQ